MTLLKPQNPPFKSYFHNKQVNNDIDKLPELLEEKFWDEYLPIIEKYPFNKPIGVGDRKHGQLKDYSSYAFHDNNGVEYRICYKNDKLQKKIIRVLALCPDSLHSA